MFEKFGEFDSYEEINRSAAAQKAEGDEEALIALAEENGIDKEDAEDYMDGCMDELCTVTTAALGKIAIEKKELEIAGVLQDWVEELEELCMESPGMAAAVRKKGKSLAGYMGMITETGWKDKVRVSQKIVDQTKEVKKFARGHDLYIGVPDRRRRKELAREYYLGLEVVK